MLMTTTCISNQIVSQRYIGFLELVSLSCVFVFCFMGWLRWLIVRSIDGTYAADRKRKAESIADDATKFCEAIQVASSSQRSIWTMAMWESSSLPLDSDFLYFHTFEHAHAQRRAHLFFPEVCFKTSATIFMSSTWEAQHSVQSKKLALTGKPAWPFQSILLVLIFWYAFPFSPEIASSCINSS